ncbi:MAG: SMP-30/gluconolactonase/LRE family protein, partial [Desulfobacterales bacterium]|nr:SMP-30/gluconolactonase/LRE family protein [Desulfobacterales bacterium]
LVREYGEYEGEMVYYYATGFANVGASLTNAQESTLMGLRLDYYERFPDYQANSNAYDCSGAWLYASKVAMPEIENTDFLFGVAGDSSVNTESVSADGAESTLIADGFSFAEGPAVNAKGDLYFSDISANRIYKWSAGGPPSVFRENSGGANGLFFDHNDDLLACEGSNGRVVSIDSSGDATLLAIAYDGKAFNEPNDLWVAPDGGVYFTDPVYNASLVQDGEHVYYLSPDRTSVTRVIDDMVRPNGVIGSGDGATLYVADHGDGKTYRYTIAADGSLTNKTLFASVGADGMTIDNEGNVYLCENNLLVYNSAGTLVETISLPEQPTNACFGGDDGRVLFITTRDAVYSLAMRVNGAGPPRPHIRANTRTGPLTAAPGDSVRVSVSLDPGRLGAGAAVDLWIAARTSFGTFWFGPSLTWVQSETPVLLGAASLFNLPDVPLLEGAPPAGSYEFQFYIDNVPNGSLDLDNLAGSDTVEVTVQ